jgi:hypothetical protein
VRRRGRSIQYGAPYRAALHSTSFNPMVHFGEPALVISEVPKEWQEHAREPWRITFPDLEWVPPSQTE